MIEVLYLAYKWDLNMYYRIRVDQGVITMKKHSTFLKTPETKPLYKMQFNVIPRTLDRGGGGLNPLQICDRHIQQPQLTGLHTS